MKKKDTTNLPAVKSLLRSMKALEWGILMSTGELRAFRQSEILEGEKKRHNLGKTQQVINM